ncbi:MAG: HPr family phosphocarrier protein [Bacillota bacterium]
MRKEFVISNQEGLHARPATTLVSKANQFKSDITITYEDTTVDLKSIMGVLSLGAERGSLVVIEAKGDDEIKAMEAITEHIRQMNLK